MDSPYDNFRENMTRRNGMVRHANAKSADILTRERGERIVAWRHTPLLVYTEQLASAEAVEWARQHPRDSEEDRELARKPLTQKVKLGFWRAM